MVGNAIKRCTQKNIWSFGLLLFVFLFLYGCGGRPVAPVYEPPAQPDSPEIITEDVLTPQPKTKISPGPAAPLHKKARALLAQQQYRQAELAMERALRIEPKNGYYWYTLAEIAFAQQQRGKTVQLCLKSQSFARGDSTLIRINDQLMAKTQ